MNSTPDRRTGRRLTEAEEVEAMQAADRAIAKACARNIEIIEREKDLMVLRSLVRDALDDVEAAA